MVLINIHFRMHAMSLTSMHAHYMHEIIFINERNIDANLHTCVVNEKHGCSMHAVHTFIVKKGDVNRPSGERILIHLFP